MKRLLFSVGVFLFFVHSAFAQEQCFMEIECPLPDYGLYQTSVAVGPIPFNIMSQLFAGQVTLGRIRRLGVPADSSEPRHLAFFEADGKGAGGAPFVIDTKFGMLKGNLGNLRWVALAATKGETAPPAPAVPGPVFICYAYGKTGAARIQPTWTDQFGDQTGSFGVPLTACLPANGTNAKPFVCYGDSRNVGRGPDNVWVDTPVTDVAYVDMDPLDDYCVQSK